MSPGWALHFSNLVALSDAIDKLASEFMGLVCVDNACSRIVRLNVIVLALDVLGNRRVLRVTHTQLH